MSSVLALSLSTCYCRVCAQVSGCGVFQIKQKRKFNQSSTTTTTKIGHGDISKHRMLLITEQRINELSHRAVSSHLAAMIKERLQHKGDEHMHDNLYYSCVLQPDTQIVNVYSDRTVGIERPLQVETLILQLDVSTGCDHPEGV